MIFDSIYGYHATNVEAQVQTPYSLAHWMKQMISIRKKYPAFGRGTMEFLRPRNDKVLAYLRQYRGDTLLMVHNLSGSAQAVELDLGRFTGVAPVELFGETRFPPISERPYMLTLSPYGFYWFKLRQAPREEAIYGIEGSVI